MRIRIFDSEKRAQQISFSLNEMPSFLYKRCRKISFLMKRRIVCERRAVISFQMRRSIFVILREKPFILVERLVHLSFAMRRGKLVPVNKTMKKRNFFLSKE
jgi:hypothetical protein